MAAPKGNQFWKLRSKHGRDKIFSSPEMLWEAACEYFDHSDNNPLSAIDFRGKDVQEVAIHKMRAYTRDGLETFLCVDSLREYKKNPSYKDFFHVISRIEKIMYNQKFQGAAAGMLNPNIIARDLGLSDKTESKVTVEQPLFSDEDKG